MSTDDSKFDTWAELESDAASMYRDEREMMQGVMARGIVRRREEIETSGFAVMQAIADCARYELVIPSWLAKEFRRRFNAVKFHRAGSWDDDQSFGKPYPKGTHLHSLRKQELWPEIHTIARKVQEEDPGRPIDEAFFDSVAERLRGLDGVDGKGLGRSEVQRIYYESLERYSTLFGPAENSRKLPVIRRRR